MILLVIIVSVLALAAGAVIIGTLRYSIPPMPSNGQMRAAVIGITASLVEDGPIFELGSGWGGLARRMALSFPGKNVTGLEMSLVPFLWSCLIKAVFGPGNLRFVRKKLLTEPLKSGTIYVCYLSTMHMARLEEKISAERFTGTIISIVFALHRMKPVHTRKIEDAFKSEIYVYRCQ